MYTVMFLKHIISHKVLSPRIKFSLPVHSIVLIEPRVGVSSTINNHTALNAGIIGVGVILPCIVGLHRTVVPRIICLFSYSSKLEAANTMAEPSDYKEKPKRGASS
jgi:hypothetical protein